MKSNIEYPKEATDEIGFIAQFIDHEMSIFERMKIKKNSLFKIISALAVYFIIMAIFTLIL
jgi:hypothetical protein